MTPPQTTSVDQIAGLVSCDVIDSIVIDRRRHVVVPIRWPGMATHNVVAVFANLQDASTAARRLAALPSSVSAAVVVPVDSAAAMSVVVGVHTVQRHVADEAAVSFRRSGARRVARFAGEAAAHPAVAPSS